MSGFKEKSQGFIIGLLVGLIVAGSFFVLKLDDYFKELSFYKSLSKTFSTDTKSVDAAEKKDEAETMRQKQPAEGKIKNKKNVTDSLQKNNGEFNTDSLNKAMTVAKDTGTKENSVLTDYIVVRKDELISTKTFEVINLSPLADKMNSKDSLVQKMSGVKDDRSGGQQLFNVEFWQSPLNYKGYKMSKYKIVLYGIFDDAVKIYKIDDIVYLKSFSMIYKLDYTSDFKQYERITEEVVINKLK